MRIRIQHAFALAVVLTAAQSSIAVQDVPDDFALTLERIGTACSCPTYSVRISAGGEVTYRGTTFVRVTGPVTGRIPAMSVQALLSTIERIGFFEFADEYAFIRTADGHQTFVTHVPTTVVRVTQNGRTKRIEDHLGAPESLRELEQQIDDIAGTRRWVRIDPSTLSQMAAAGRPPSRAQMQELLRTALYADDVDVIEALLQMGAGPNELPGNDLSGATLPLIIVRSAAAARALIAAGADASAVDGYGQAPLRQAASLSPEVTGVLLQAGAAVDMPVDRSGTTALIVAAGVGNLGAVKLLLAAGANPRSRISSGTALDAARQSRTFNQRRLSPPPGPATFTPDFDGVIATLESALAVR
jgi:hypothetical protein